MFDKLKQMKDMHSQAKAMQKALSDERITGEAIQGKVKVTMDGNQEIQEVFISPELLTAENQEELQNAIKEAFQDCVKELKSLMMKKVQSGEIAF